MRKAFDRQKESFSVFSSALVAGDTAILGALNQGEGWLGRISRLLQRGIVVRTPGQVGLDAVLQQDSDTVEGLARLAGVIDRKAEMQAPLVANKAKAALVKKQKGVLEAKVHRLIEERGLGVVAACRKVHCRPSDYYIYRSKQKAGNYGR